MMMRRGEGIKAAEGGPRVIYFCFGFVSLPWVDRVDEDGVGASKGSLSCCCGWYIFP